MQIRIKRLDEDEYVAPHVELIVSGEGYSARQDLYVEHEEWLDFGLALQSFPKSLAHEVVFERGDPAENYYCYILLRAFVYNGIGHTAIEVKMDNHSDPPDAASAHFYLPCEAASLNRLGKSLELWSRSKEYEFVFSTEAD